MPRVVFEPTTPVFEQAGTVHDLDRAAAVIGKRPLRLLFVYLMAVLYCIYYIVSNDRMIMNVKLGNIWNEAVVVHFSIISEEEYSLERSRVAGDSAASRI
jgi:hypothetical protein